MNSRVHITRPPGNAARRAALSPASGVERKHESTTMASRSHAPGRHDFGSMPVQRRVGGPSRAGAGAAGGSRSALPERLRSGIEALSGMSMADVKVHYNSPMPSQVEAHAYTQGSHIHIGHGQERHLAHEAWHVVQQKQGRVRPTMKVNGRSVNDDDGLEREADRMAARAASATPTRKRSPEAGAAGTVSGPIQRARTKQTTQGKGNKKNTLVQPNANLHVPMKSQTPKKQSAPKKQSKKQSTTPKKQAIIQSALKTVQQQASQQANAQTNVQSPPQQPQTTTQGPPSTDVFTNHLDFMGAKQQGQVTTDHGKEYAGPVSMRKNRSQQVKRHITNLVLNRLTHDQNQAALLTASSGVQKPTKKGDGKKEKKPKGDVPVEIQMSTVGKRMLMNSNNPKASLALAQAIQNEGGLMKYISHPNALIPAMDQDMERPKRQFSKLQKALKKERPWQKSSTDEDPDDIKQASSILDALENEKSAALFDQNDDKAMASELGKWQNDTAPRLYVPIHHKTNDLKNEHAERVQTRVRKAHLGAYEDALSTPPSGPKTTCLGCQSHLTANYQKSKPQDPPLAPNDPYNGAYFDKSSPASTDKEKAEALKLVTTRPSTGSISQEGYLRNSDYPDSDSDDEGKPAFPYPRGYKVPFGGKAPAKTTWRIDENTDKEYPAKTKRAQILKRPKVTKPKSPKAVNTNTPSKGNKHAGQKRTASGMTPPSQQPSNKTKAPQSPKGPQRKKQKTGP